MRTSERTGALRRELEDRIKNGSCVYCRAPAAPDRPLTREHVIPQARGGRRRDSRIIVPACARCNGRRGCQEVVLFLLARPRRIAAFLEYLSALPPETVRQLDLRVFAELYAAVWLLGESAYGGSSWRERLRHLCSGRRLHRRRYAARRVVTEVGRRLERARGDVGGPSCPLPGEVAAPVGEPLQPALARVMATLVGTLSVLWEVPAERVAEELRREIARSGARARREAASPGVADHGGTCHDGEEDDTDVVSLDGWRGRRAGRRRRVRVDRRGRGGRFGRGRAA